MRGRTDEACCRGGCDGCGCGESDPDSPRLQPALLMPDYLVWPLNEDPRYPHTPLLNGTLVDAHDPREAARMVRGDSPVGLDRWVTLGPEGITRLDFSEALVGDEGSPA